MSPNDGIDEDLTALRAAVTKLRARVLPESEAGECGRCGSEQLVAYEALRKSEAKYRNLFELAPVAMFQARADSLDLFDVNVRTCELVGSTREEVLARRATHWWADSAHRELMLQRLHTAGRIEEFETVILDARGERIPVLVNARLDPEGVIEGSITDITARQRSERALRDTIALYRSVLDAMTDGIVVHDERDAIVAANTAAERILGLPLDQIVGRTAIDPRWRSIREDGSPLPGEEHPSWVTRRTGEPRTGVIMGIHKPSGELTWLSVNSRRVMPLGEEGAYSVVASFADITDKKLSDERLVASLREKEVLLNEIHHRVKNNLQMVTSLLYLQSSRTDDPDAGDLLRECRNRIAAMSLVHQQLYESPDLSRVPFDSYVRGLARALYDSYGVSSERIALRTSTNGIAFSVGVAMPCGLVLNELVANALKHAFPGNARGTITIELAPAGDSYDLRFADDGIGLPSDIDERAASTLGMKLLERLTAQLGGTLARRSSPSGTSYVLTFPRERSG